MSDHRSAENDRKIDDARAEFIKARLALTLAVEAACPGPHVPRQHRDARPPWCPVCGRFADGAPVAPAKGRAR